MQGAKVRKTNPQGTMKADRKGAANILRTEFVIWARGGTNPGKQTWMTLMFSRCIVEK